MHDIERTFTDRRGECLLSKSAVSGFAAYPAAGPMLAELARAEFVKRFERRSMR